MGGVIQTLRGSYRATAGDSLPAGYVTLNGLTWAPMTTGGTYAQSQTYAANFTGLGFPAGTWRTATVAELQSLAAVLIYAEAKSIYGWTF